MATLQALFERLEYWRNFPGFQLERHVDVFISFYLKQVIEEKFNTPISDYLIPEFPINQHLIVTSKNGGQWSNKVDFALPSKDLSDIYFIELKTDMKSKRTSQDKLMEKCNGMMFYEFLVGIKKYVWQQSIMRNTQHCFLTFKILATSRFLKRFGA